MPYRLYRWFLVGIVLTGLVLPPVGRGVEPPSRPATWATKIERPGLPNLHKVSDQLYRGAQPTAEGVRELEKLGVKTIVCLRAEHSDQDILGDSKIVAIQIPMNAWDVNETRITEFLKIATDKNRQPVFVHCLHGSDRTGAMCAAYRVVVDHWPKQQAIDEMTRGGFGFHPVWMNLPRLIEKLDVEKVRDAVKPQK
jgi:protein tyrosine phosphatase (PTP) superfamily phosphohydrolase (DUF442 family)